MTCGGARCASCGKPRTLPRAAYAGSSHNARPKAHPVLHARVQPPRELSAGAHTSSDCDKGSADVPRLPPRSMVVRRVDRCSATVTTGCSLPVVSCWISTRSMTSRVRVTCTPWVLRQMRLSAERGCCYNSSASSCGVPLQGRCFTPTLPATQHMQTTDSSVTVKATNAANHACIFSTLVDCTLAFWQHRRLTNSSQR